MGEAWVAREASRKKSKSPRRDVMQAWVEEELQNVDIGDERLDQRYQLVLDRLSQRPSVSIPAACGNWKETCGAYRFFENERVGAPDVLGPHRQATLERIKQQPVVLIPQDTTEIDVTRKHERMRGAGPLNDGSRVGFYNHVMFAVTPERIPLGVVAAELWARDEEEFEENQKDKKAKEKKKKEKPIEEKESFRWLQGYRRACEVAAQAPRTTVVCISDSEGDIHECFVEAAKQDTPQNTHWIVRACQDRSLAKANGGCDKLWEEVGATKVLGTLQVKVSKNEPRSQDERKRKQPRSARIAEVTVRAKRVTLKAPQRNGVKLPDVQVNAILVQEIDPPSGEPAIEWLLLTDLPIDSFAQLCTVIEHYCCRWQIEIYFRILKSGCKVEDRQFEDAEHYLPCLALYMVVAWRVMHVMMLGRECPELPSDAVLSEEEWKSVYLVVRHKEPPRKAPPLGEMVKMIGGLGGHLGRKHDGPPGPKAMWVGIQRMMDFALAYRACRPRPQAHGPARSCV